MRYFMTNFKLALLGLMNSVGVALYTGLVAWVMYNGNRFFGTKDTILTMISILLLFVLSAAIVGALTIGRPIILFVNGLRSSAVRLFLYTVSWLMVITLGVLIYQAWR
jgi:uncharacterized membrane protein